MVMFISTASGNQVGIIGTGDGLENQHTKITIGLIVFEIGEDSSELTARAPDVWEYEPMDDKVIKTTDDEETQWRED